MPLRLTQVPFSGMPPQPVPALSIPSVTCPAIPLAVFGPEDPCISHTLAFSAHFSQHTEYKSLEPPSHLERENDFK